MRGLLHAYLTNDIKTERDEDCISENDETGVDPMMIVQCSLGDDTPELSQPEENFDLIEKPFNTSKLFYSEYPAEVQIWTSSGHTKRILLNKNHEEIELHNMLDTNDEISDQNEKKHTCPVCGKVVTSKENLKVHVETHRPKGKYECTKCGRM